MLKRFSSFLVALILYTSGLATGAEIQAFATGTDLILVAVEGDIVEGDYERFIQATAGVQLAGVVLSSDGGNLQEGLRIGREIRRRGFVTGVAPDFACASACALIWLGGVSRFMAPSALIGFHAAFRETSYGRSESGVANALVGAYLSELGLSEEAIIFATRADPYDIQWLTIETANQLGITVDVLDIKEPTQGIRQFVPTDDLPLQLPSGFRWIVLTSAPEKQGLLIAPFLRTFDTLALTIVQTHSGYFALVAGPFEQSVAELLVHEMTSTGAIPADAFLSSGNGFLRRSQ